MDEIRKGCYSEELTQLRSLWDVYGESKPKSTTIIDACTEQITRVCLTAAIAKKNGTPAVLSYNDLVLLEIGGLRSHDFAEQVRVRAFYSYSYSAEKAY